MVWEVIVSSTDVYDDSGKGKCDMRMKRTVQKKFVSLTCVQILSVLMLNRQIKDDDEICMKSQVVVALPEPGAAS